tara:strand:+ start:179 stop:367 length:189 start_codon:yes stop_codon:yes gene_type:complete
MTKERILQLHEAASNGIMRPELAANMLVEVCETALELFKIVERHNAQLEKYQRARSIKYVPE